MVYIVPSHSHVLNTWITVAFLFMANRFICSGSFACCWPTQGRSFILVKRKKKWYLLKASLEEMEGPICFKSPSHYVLEYLGGRECNETTDLFGQPSTPCPRLLPPLPMVMKLGLSSWICRFCLFIWAKERCLSILSFRAKEVWRNHLSPSSILQCQLHFYFIPLCLTGVVSENFCCDMTIWPCSSKATGSLIWKASL